MKMNKEKFLKSELGSGMIECVKYWDYCILKFGNLFEEQKYRMQAAFLQAQWEVYKMAVRQFYGIEYCFSRTDEYFGVCTEDETDWLFKVER